MNFQHKKILEILSDGDWHCTSEMRSEYMADPPKRLQELRDHKGYLFYLPRICTKHDYHKGGVKEWRLLEKPFQTKETPARPAETPKAEPRAVQPEKPRIIENAQPRGLYSQPKTFMEAYEQERKRKGLPLTPAEMKELAKKYK